MLVERVFEIGGALCVGLGAVLVSEFAETGGSFADLLSAGSLSIAFGVMFVYVGRAARRHRLDLLSLGDPGQAEARDTRRP